MKNKKILLGIICLVILLFTILWVILLKSDENVVLNENRNNKNKINNSFLTYMVETDSGSGIYEKTTANSWPESGYIFNSTLSGCENGGELKWDDENKQVLMLSVKSDKCYVYFDKYNVAKITNVTNTKTTNSVTLTVTTEAGENPIDKYYFSKDNGNSYVESSTSSYTFSGLNDNTTYKFKVYAKDTLGYETNETDITVTTDNLILLADYIKGLYTSQGENGIYYHTSSLANSAEDNSYRYAGANPNNYVCFGSDATTCPSDNLYRIIGVFGSEVKLIKADYTTTTMTGSGGDYYGAYNILTSNYKGSMNTSNIASYYWNNSSGSSSRNTWSESRLNKTNLNSSYLSYIGSTWSNKIATHTWYVGGYSTYAATPKTFYNAESSGTTYSAKIGLMYVSDYGYAASNSYWTTNMDAYSSAKNNNWMYMGLNEWTISRNSYNSNNAFMVHMIVDLYFYDVYDFNLAVRPVFYLNSNITYVSGSGTSSDPIRIN